MDKTFNIITTFCTKVGVDNHNPVKTSNINKPGAIPQIFCKVCVIAEPSYQVSYQVSELEEGHVFCMTCKAVSPRPTHTDCHINTACES